MSKKHDPTAYITELIHERDYLRQVVATKASELTRLREQVEWRQIPDDPGFEYYGPCEIYDGSAPRRCQLMLTGFLSHNDLKHGYTHYRPFTAPEVESDE